MNESCIDIRLIEIQKAWPDVLLLKDIPGRGVCGLRRLAYTVALLYDLEPLFYKGRYCFHTMAEATSALKEWDGLNDPIGNWIIHKGKDEYANPDYEGIH